MFIRKLAYFAAFDTLTIFAPLVFACDLKISDGLLLALAVLIRSTISAAGCVENDEDDDNNSRPPLVPTGETNA